MIQLQFNRLIKKISRDFKINEIPRNTQTTYRANFNEPEELVKDIFRFSGYSIEQEYNEQLNFHSYFDKNPRFFEIIELNDLVELLTSNQNHFENIDINDKEKIIKTIKNYIIFLYQKEQKIVFDKDELEKYANGLEAYFRGDEMIFISKSPLDGFYSNVERIELEKDLSIQRISLNEREELFSRYSHLSNFTRSNLLLNEYWLINEYIPKEKAMMGINAYAQFIDEEFLKFLRLFKNGTIGIHHSKSESKYWNPEFSWYDGLSSQSFTHVVGNGNYIIEKDEINQFIDLWTKYRKIDFSRDGALNIAIKRFNDSFTRRDVEDRIIDLMIAFEALFLKEDEKMELTFKLALRTAIFLKNKDVGGDDLFHFMKVAYNTRSNIIHGAKTKDKIKVKKSINVDEYDELTLHEFLNKLEDIFRKCLLRYIKEFSNFQINELIDSIDKKILK